MKYIFLLGMLCLSTWAMAQNSITVTVVDAETDLPLPGATVRLSTGQGAATDVDGEVVFTDIPEGAVTLEVSYVGYTPQTLEYVFPGAVGQLTVRLNAGEELEEVTISATRSSRTIEDLPTRVEIIGPEELEEKAVMRSSNIAMLLRESTGIQMQQTSVSSANQSIRIQGMDGRYTQLLKDGFPLFGGFAGGLSIMQIPPLDLKQVEVLKGSHSTLYGGGAIAGLVNLVSYTPKDGNRMTFMVDQTTALGTTANAFFARQWGKVGLTLYGSANRQQAYDPNGDAFSDIPQIRSLTFNPQLFVYPNEESSLRVGLNTTFANRLGGDMRLIAGETNPQRDYLEENASQRGNVQVDYEWHGPIDGDLRVRHSTNTFRRRVTQPAATFGGQQWSTFSEASYSLGAPQNRWVLGVNVYTDEFTEEPTDSLVRDYAQYTGGMFVQNTWDFAERFSLESGMRLDYNTDYGAFPLPRLGLLVRLAPGLTARLGGGLGYKLPTIFTEGAENRVYRGIQPIMPESLEAERSLGTNVDVNYKVAFGGDWTFSINQLFFYTQLQNALTLEQAAPDTYVFANATGPTRSQGFETNVKLTFRDFKLFANYAFLDVVETRDALVQPKLLTARHNFGGVLVYEVEGKWRIGYESYYTGPQLLEANRETPGYWLMGFMVLRKFEKLSVYLNFENFTDTRIHRLEAFDVANYLPPGTPQIWAPTDGRVINGGLIFRL